MVIVPTQSSSRHAGSVTNTIKSPARATCSKTSRASLNRPAPYTSAPPPAYPRRFLGLFQTLLPRPRAHTIRPRIQCRNRERGACHHFHAATKSQSPPSHHRASGVGKSRKIRGAAAAVGGIGAARGLRPQPAPIPSTRRRRVGETERSSSADVASQVPCHPAPFLTCDDATCLTRCHRAFVSRSCHFFRAPLSIPWRHFQSLVDADQPIRKVPSRDGYPRRSSLMVQHRWEMKDPAAHCIWPVENLYYP